MQQFGSQGDGVTVDIAPGPAGTLTATFRAKSTPGTLAAFAGTLTVHGLDIVSAVLSLSPDGTVTDSFGVVPREARTPTEADAQVMARYASDVLEGVRNLDADLRAVRAAHVRADDIETRVEANTHSELTTGIDISCPDRPGLLYDMAATLSRHGARVRALSVLGFNRKAVVSFRLVDEGGRPLVGAGLEGLRADMFRCCAN